MSNPAGPFWRAVFAAAALMNLTVGLALMLAFPALLPLLDMTGPENPFLGQLAGGLIAVFGVGYAIIARAPGQHRDLVLLGLIGKALAPLIGGLNLLSGQVSAKVFALLLGDLAFAALFAVFLIRTPDVSRERGGERP